MEVGNYKRLPNLTPYHVLRHTINAEYKIDRMDNCCNFKYLPGLSYIKFELTPVYLAYLRYCIQTY